MSFNFQRPASPTIVSTKSVNFTSPSQYVDMGTVAIETGLGPFSISLWVYIPTQPETEQYFVYVSTWQDGIDLSDSGYGLMFYKRGDTGQLTWSFLFFRTPTDAVWWEFETPTIVDDNWHQIVVTYNGIVASDSVKFYVDGVENEVVSDYLLEGTPTPCDNLPQRFVIGSVTADNYIVGYVGDVAKWSVVLSQGEITELYNGGVELNLRKHSQWAAIKSSSRGCWIHWENSDLEAVNGVSDLSAQKYLASGTGLLNATDLVLYVPPNS